MCFLLGGGTGDNPLRGRFFLRGATGIPFLRGGAGSLSGFFLKERNSFETYNEMVMKEEAQLELG